MAAPLFDQSEVLELLRCKKYVEYDAKHRRKSNRQGRLVKMLAYSEDFPNAEFFIENDAHLPGCNFILSVDMKDGRPQEAICRYDLQENVHTNPDGTLTLPWQPHRHIYQVDSVRNFGVWDKYAEPLQLKKAVCAELFSKFLTDLNIHYSDTDTQLFNFMNVQ